MRTSITVLALMGLLSLPAWTGAMGHGKGKPQPIPCPPDVGAALAEACPCAAASNHGQYVKCVVHLRNALRKSGCLSGDEKRTIARCAARSTCGKDTVLCCNYVVGTCSDPMPGDLVVAGTCSNDATLACDTDADCTTSTSRIVHDATACTGAGDAVVDGGGSVCSPCPPLPTTTTTTTTLP
jgi:hypothetical protein